MDLGGDGTGGDLQIDDGAMANVGAASGQAVGEVAVGLEVIAPLFPPERAGDGTAGDGDGCEDDAFLAIFLALASAWRRRSATGTYGGNGE